MFLKISQKNLQENTWHKWFPVNLEKFLRTPFYIKHFRWLLLLVLSTHPLNTSLCTSAWITGTCYMHREMSETLRGSFIVTKRKNDFHLFFFVASKIYLSWEHCSIPSNDFSGYLDYSFSSKYSSCYIQKQSPETFYEKRCS